MRSLVFAAVVGWGGGCWGGVAPQVTTPVAVAPPAPSRDVPAYSVWRGTYNCPQGVTGMRLRIGTEADGTARATFEFFAVEENPRVPSGAFTMTGAMYLTDDGVYELRLEPDKWIDQPTDYIMVGLRAKSEANLRAMHGRIDSSMCNGFDVTRER